MNSQDRADLKKYQELKEQRRTASKKYNASHVIEIQARRIAKNQIKKETEAKELMPSLVKPKTIKPIEVIKPIKEPIKPVIDNVDYKTMLFTKPKKIMPLKMPLKMQKKMQKDDLIFI